MTHKAFMAVTRRGNASIPVTSKPAGGFIAWGWERGNQHVQPVAVRACLLEGGAPSPRQTTSNSSSEAVASDALPARFRASGV